MMLHQLNNSIAEMEFVNCQYCCKAGAEVICSGEVSVSCNAMQLTPDRVALLLSTGTVGHSLGC